MQAGLKLVIFLPPAYEEQGLQMEATAVVFSSNCKSKVAEFPQEDTKQILVTNIIWLFVWPALDTGQCGFVLSSHVPWQFCKVAATSTPISLSSERTGRKGEETPLSDHEASSVSLGHSSSPYQEEFFFIFEVIFAVVMDLLHRPRVITSQNN